MVVWLVGDGFLCVTPSMTAEYSLVYGEHWVGFTTSTNGERCGVAAVLPCDEHSVPANARAHTHSHT